MRVHLAFGPGDRLGWCESMRSLGLQSSDICSWVTLPAYGGLSAHSFQRQLSDGCLQFQFKWLIYYNRKYITDRGSMN